jgi:uncharacterized protein YndB with AHSA1/START domain
MKLTSTIVVDRPRERVLELIMEPGAFSQWQPGVRSFELLGGQQGQVGARARVVFDMHGMRMEMTETIVERRLPDLYALKYEARGVKNLVENRFYVQAADKTRWEITNVLEISRLMAVAAPLLHELVTKQNAEAQRAFKEYAEKS